MRNLTKLMVAAILVLLLSGALLLGGTVARDGATLIRWDIVSLQAGPPLMALPGGVASAQANDGTKITLTGTGTFVPGETGDVTGGGTWTIRNATGEVTGSGTYRVTGLVRFDEAPGMVPLSISDTIGTNADSRAGLAVLRITYSDGSRGLLVISCHLEGTPDSVFEGITASKDFVDFWNREAPNAPDMPLVDANRTVFHVLLPLSGSPE